MSKDMLFFCFYQKFLITSVSDKFEINMCRVPVVCIYVCVQVEHGVSCVDKEEGGEGEV